MQAVISLLLLLFTIAAANIKKINIGLVALASAMTLGLVFHLPISEVLSGINIKLLTQMFSVQLLVSISKTNGTLTYLAGRIRHICREKTVRIFPVVLYVLMLSAEVFGLNLHELLLPIMAAIAFSLQIAPLKVIVIGELAMLAGCFSPYSVPGIMLYEYAADAGLSVNVWSAPVLCAISYTAFFIAVYFFCGWHKMRLFSVENNVSVKPSIPQLVTICAYLIMVAANLLFSVDISITATLCAFLLCLFRCVNAQEAVNDVPYSMLVMIAGMASLISVIGKLGGVELFSAAIVSIQNQKLVTIIMTVFAGIMSIFSSASTVVQPSLIHTIPTIQAALPNISAQSLVVGIAVGSYATCISPMSSNGARIMSAYAAIYDPNESDRLKTFNSLLRLSLVLLLYQGILSWIGFYQISLF